MRHAHRIHDQSGEPEPNLFDYVPKNVWREIYLGHWGQLTLVQKAEFFVEVVFFVLFIGSLVYHSFHSGNLLSLSVSFGLVWLVLGGFFWLLARYVR
jgi:hypothetical protein